MDGNKAIDSQGMIKVHQINRMINYEKSEFDADYVIYFINFREIADVTIKKHYRQK